MLHPPAQEADLGVPCQSLDPLRQQLRNPQEGEFGSWLKMSHAGDPLLVFDKLRQLLMALSL